MGAPGPSPAPPGYEQRRAFHAPDEHCRAGREHENEHADQDSGHQSVPTEAVQDREQQAEQDGHANGCGNYGPAMFPTGQRGHPGAGQPHRGGREGRKRRGEAAERIVELDNVEQRQPRAKQGKDEQARTEIYGAQVARVEPVP